MRGGGGKKWANYFTWLVTCYYKKNTTHKNKTQQFWGFCAHWRYTNTELHDDILCVCIYIHNIYTHTHVLYLYLVLASIDFQCLYLLYLYSAVKIKKTCGTGHTNGEEGSPTTPWYPTTFSLASVGVVGGGCLCGRWYNRIEPHRHIKRIWASQVNL